VAEFVNKQKPLSWTQEMSSIYVPRNGKYIVRFGTEADCQRSLSIKTFYEHHEIKYLIDWENKYLNYCSSIAGYIDTSKMYVIYQGGEWIDK
jgi:hypothetical protein